MGVASYMRFAVGLALSIEIIRQLILRNEISFVATALSIVFIVLSLWFFVGKFILKM